MAGAPPASPPSPSEPYPPAAPPSPLSPPVTVLIGGLEPWLLGLIVGLVSLFALCLIGWGYYYFVIVRRRRLLKLKRPKLGKFEEQMQTLFMLMDTDRSERANVAAKRAPNLESSRARAQTTFPCDAFAPTRRASHPANRSLVALPPRAHFHPLHPPRTAPATSRTPRWSVPSRGCAIM